MPSFEDAVPNVADLEQMFRGRGGGLRPADRTDRAVVILVSGRGVERSSWSDDVEVGEDDFERLLNESPPAPDLDDRNGAKFRALDPASRGATVQRCSQCAFRPADGKCVRCGGTGQISVGGDELEKCSACEGGIARSCSTCGGSRRSVNVKVVFGEDTLRPFAHIFLPDVPFPLREPLTRFFKARANVPDVLTIDLADDFAAADAYRGRRSRAEIHGHRADAALALARNYVARVTRLPTLITARAEAFAWPVLLIGYDGEPDFAFALVKDEAGGAHLLP